MNKLILRIFRKFKRIILFLCSFPISFVLIIIFPFYKIRLIGLISDRIGHYTVNTELLLCYLDEIYLTEKRVKHLFYLSEAPICNKQLNKMWKRVITILPFAVIASYVDSLMFQTLGEAYRNSEIKENFIAQDVHERLKTHKPHLFFTTKELKHGSELLLNLGIPANTPFICLLARDAAYLSQHLPGNDWSYHSFRDCDVNNFAKAAVFLANKGYYVLRMGKSVEKSFDAKHPNIIDYAQSSLKSDFADIYLSAHCHFFISTSSGLDGVAQIFRRPILFVNVAPFKQLLQYWYPCEYFITKKVFDINKKKYLSLKEIDHKLALKDDALKVCNEHSWIIEDNTEDEILAAVQEMEDHINKKTDMKKSNIFHLLLPKEYPFSMIQSRDLLRSHPEKFYVKIGTQFWKDNQTLFSE